MLTPTQVKPSKPGQQPKQSIKQSSKKYARHITLAQPQSRSPHYDRFAAITEIRHFHRRTHNTNTAAPSS
ncbi:hypothetical protein [Nonomuraea sp. KM90]|uniref:hypothetical protein n=1 Tax=Nonomuraea sp. KM90 TaxID=3457428 RepID=UPI003FCE96C9